MTESASRAADAPPPPRALRGIISLDDFEAPARRYIPRPIFGYVKSAS
ncbi:MAG: alpha-hydroxy-acid oxidizing protein, partial [Rhizobiales bacterium]|nr:alpha-hydroxy-acid oxidizing protein [Hyphomicrobiales bacterium]